jgi:recombination protein RecA
MTNQTKTDVKVTFGNKNAHIGGTALKFHASIILEMSRGKLLKVSDAKDAEAYGAMTWVKSAKNKLLIPFKSVEVPIIFGKGIDYDMSLFKFLKDNKVIAQKGSYYRLEVPKYKVNIKGQGEKKFLAGLAEYTETARMRNILESLVA